MSKHTLDIIAALKSKDFHRANQSFEAAVHEKLAARIGQERESLRLSEDAPPPIPHADVQRVYDECRDLSETETLCGIKDLKVNENGEVVSFVPKTVNEAKEPEKCELCGSTQNIRHADDGTPICKGCDIEEHCGNPDTDPTDGKSKFVKEMAFGQPVPPAELVKKVEALFAKVQKLADDAHERQVNHHIAKEVPYDWELGMTVEDRKKQLLELNKRVIDIKPKSKYINIDCGGSGQLMIDTTDGRIYGIKGYGQVNKGHNWYGTVDNPKLKAITAKIVGTWSERFIRTESLRVVDKLLK